MMTKANLNKVINYIKYSAMILFVLSLGYVIFFETENFCVTTGGRFDLIDEVDRGEKCFKTIGESNEYKLYLIDKYDIGKEEELHFNLNNLSIN
jgi:hypothetical protein